MSLKWPDYKYIEVALGGVNKRNNVVELGRLKNPTGQTDCYRTVFRYPEAFKQHVDNMGTVKGYKGPQAADFFPIDIDDAEDLHKAHETAKKIITHLAENYELDLSALRCYFSGAKGFHILICEAVIDTYPGVKLSAIFKRMARTLLEGVSYDPSIYDATRLFRLANTINSKTGLHKIPLTPAEILHNTTEEIIKMADKPRQVEVVNDFNVNSILHDLYIQCGKEQDKPAPVDTTEITPPKDAKLCYYSLLQGVGEGERDNAALRLAVYFRKQGYAADMVGGLLTAWNNRNNPKLTAEDVAKTVKQGFENSYDFGCNDFLLMEYCDHKCHLKKKQKDRVTLDNIYTMGEAKQKYLEYIQSLERRKISLGFPVIDREMRGIAPGEVCEILARSGVGKTAAVLNIIKKQSQAGINVLFFSLEQPLAQIYERSAQIAGGATGLEVETAYKKQNALADDLSVVVSDKYKNLYVVDEDYLTYEELRDFIVISPQKIGEKPGVVIIDYLGRMKGGKGSTYEVTSELAKLLKRMAKETDTAIIYLHQTNRSGKTGAEPVTMDMARDSGVVEEAADFVIGMWRPDIDKPEAQASPREEIRVGLLKNRKGGLCNVGMCFTKQLLQITPWEKGDIKQGNVFSESEVPF